MYQKPILTKEQFNNLPVLTIPFREFIEMTGRNPYELCRTYNPDYPMIRLADGVPEARIIIPELHYSYDELEDTDDLLENIQILKNKEKRATTVKWGDGSVTVVKAAKGQKMDDYHAFTAAFAKRVIGNNTRIEKIVSKTEEIKKKAKNGK